MFKAGNVERILVFGILLIIGLILVVAIKGAKDLEEGRDPESTGSTASLRNETDTSSEADTERDSTRFNRGRRQDMEERLDEDLKDALEKATGGWNPDLSNPGSIPGSGTPGSMGSLGNGSPSRLTGPGSEAGGESGVGTPSGATPQDDSRAPGSSPGDSMDPIIFELDKSKVAGDRRPGRIGTEDQNGSHAGKPRTEGGGQGRSARTGGAGDRTARQDEGPKPGVETPPTTRAGKGWTYTVKSGDILGRISDRLYGTSKLWPEIAAANPGVDPDHLKVDTKLKLPRAPLHPEVAGVARAGAAPVAGSKQGNGGASGNRTETAGSSRTEIPRFRRMVKRDTHKVKSGDTLMNIALGAYGTKSAYKMILAANKDVLPDENRLVLNQVLKLPAN